MRPQMTRGDGLDSRLGLVGCFPLEESQVTGYADHDVDQRCFDGHEGDSDDDHHHDCDRDHDGGGIHQHQF